MSTEIKTDMKTHALTSYWGGDENGVMVQVTCTKPVKLPSDGYTDDLFDQEGFIQLNLSEATALCNALNDYIVEECNRRKSLLQAEIDRLQTIKGTVFNEVAALNPDLFKVSHLATTLVDKFCPTTKRNEHEQAQ